MEGERQRGQAATHAESKRADGSRQQARRTAGGSVRVGFARQVRRGVPRWLTLAITPYVLWAVPVAKERFLPWLDGEALRAAGVEQRL